MTPAEADALERELRDMRKRLDRLETLVEKLARRDVVPLEPHLNNVNILGARRGIDPLGR